MRCSTRGAGCFFFFFYSRLGRWVCGYMENGIQTPIVRGRSTKIISMMKWIRTSRLQLITLLDSIATTAAHPSVPVWGVDLGFRIL